MKYSKVEYDNLIVSSKIPVAVLECQHTTPVSMHCHDFYEFVYVREGYTVHYYGKRTTILTEGDMFVICPGVPHAYTGLHRTSVYNCVFLPEAIKNRVSEMHDLPGTEWMYFDNDPDCNWMRIKLDPLERIRVTALLEKMKEEQEQKQFGWEILMRSYLEQFIILFSRYYQLHYLDENAEKSYFSYVVKVLNYIETHYSEQIDLNTMADSLDISADYLSRQFKKVMGLSPAIYLRSYRLARAMDIMRTEFNTTLGMISERVGYKHLSHFSREFKVFTGVTPSEYRGNYYEL